MRTTTTNNEFRYYMHDGPGAFSFELAGTLSDSAARELDQARRTASSTVAGQALIVDLSYVTQVDALGLSMLRRWYEDGAQLVAKQPRARAIVASITGKAPALIAQGTQHQTWFPVRAATFSALAAILLFVSIPGLAADLKPETVQRWDEYVKTVETRNQEHLAPGSSFLSSDEIQGQTAKLRSGEILVAPAVPHVPLRVPSGLIHDWIGAAFIPNATLDEVLPLVRDYGRYKEFYRPNVLDSRIITTAESKDRFSMLLMNKSVIAKTALDTDYQSSYTRVNDHRWYGVTESTRIQEIAEYETPSQHTLPENHGTGLIWRLYSIARFEERDGGVYIELEAIALSRDIPVALRWMVDPIVRRVSRSSLTTSLQQTESAVRSHSGSISITSADHPACTASKSCVPVPATASPVRAFR